VESSCECGEELSGSIECWETMEWPLEQCSAPWSWDRNRSECAGLIAVATAITAPRVVAPASVRPCGHEHSGARAAGLSALSLVSLLPGAGPGLPALFLAPHQNVAWRLEIDRTLILGVTSSPDHDVTEAFRLTGSRLVPQRVMRPRSQDH
jgi:hypothetical protein